MTSFRRFLVLSTMLTIAGFGSAQASAVGAGAYSLAVGAAAPCGVTLVADGTATYDAACSSRTSNYSHWVRTPTGVQFQDGVGTVAVILKAKGDSYSGVSLADGHNVTLTPATLTASH